MMIDMVECNHHVELLGKEVVVGRWLVEGREEVEESGIGSRCDGGEIKRYEVLFP